MVLELFFFFGKTPPLLRDEATMKAQRQQHSMKKHECASRKTYRIWTSNDIGDRLQSVVSIEIPLLAMYYLPTTPSAEERARNCDFQARVAWPNLWAITITYLQNISCGSSCVSASNL